MHSSLDRVDHLVFAVPDLAAGIDYVADLLGVVPTAGGVHPGWGTANALLSLGPGCFFEVIGPDPGQPDFRGERLFQIDRLDQPRLVTWAARGRQLAELANRDLGIPGRVGAALPASRRRHDGTELRWVLTDPSAAVADGVVPFFIDWGASPHPADSAPGGVRLLKLEFTHPEPEAVSNALRRLGLEFTVIAGSSPGIHATLATAAGERQVR